MIEDSFEKKMISSKRKPNLIETDHCKEFYNKTFQKLLTNNNIQHYSRNTYLGALFGRKN